MATHSRSPWSAYDLSLKCADGDVVAEFKHASDLDFSVSAVNDYETLQVHCYELEDSDKKLDGILDGIDAMIAKVKTKDLSKEEILEMLRDLLDV